MSETKLFNEEHLPHLLPLYYKRLFPHVEFCRWLSYGKAESFAKRELSFTLFGDIYIRFQSFDTHEEFITELFKKFPIKIDIGAIYIVRPKQRKMGTSYKPMAKEIVFDIDMTDYDAVRTCCSGADVCIKCWKFLAIAAKVIDRFLREDLGFVHILWVFSGRRGIHAWVCDQAALSCDDNERSAIAEHLNIFEDSMDVKAVNLPGYIHTKIKKDLQIIDKYFPTILKEQDLLGTDRRLEKFIKLIDRDLQEPIKESMSLVEGSEARWDAFIACFKQLLLKNQIPRYSKNLIERVKLNYCYPRIDINVTKGTGHLLKAPFCVHPKTGKLCVPFSVQHVDNFDPNKVPTISMIMDEVDAYDKKTKEQEESLSIDMEEPLSATKPKIRDYKKTSLLKAVNLFKGFIRNLEKGSRSTEPM